jgi:hypothetical protein
MLYENDEMWFWTSQKLVTKEQVGKVSFTKQTNK